MVDNPVLRFERRDTAKRTLRFYTLQVMPNLFGEWGLLRAWGRIGRRGQVRADCGDGAMGIIKKCLPIRLVITE